MARKPTPQKRQARSPSRVKRMLAKHRTLKAVQRFAWLKKPLHLFLTKTVSIPKLDVEVPFAPALAFAAVLGLAIGVGYWGAKSLFGGNGQAVYQSHTHPARQTHSLEGVILAEPDGTHGRPPLAYEEKVAEEVYEEPPLDAAVPRTSQDMSEPAHQLESTRPSEVASLPPPGAVPSVVPPSAPDVQGPLPLWRKNAVTYDVPPGAPKIAIVIDDMGVDRKRSRRMWEDVDAPLTLSFMTYADDLEQQSGAARAMGHELMLHMSMEPSNAAIDAGPNVLLTAMEDGEIRKFANWGMDRFDGFVGVNNHMGSRFTEDARAMRVVLEEIHKRGLMYLDSRTSSNTVGPRLARQMGLPFLERNVFLDNENVTAKVLKQLGEAERLARKYGRSIAIGHPRDATIEALKSWLPEARARGFAIVPVSVLMREKLERRAAQNRG